MSHLKGCTLKGCTLFTYHDFTFICKGHFILLALLHTIRPKHFHKIIYMIQKHKNTSLVRDKCVNLIYLAQYRIHRQAHDHGDEPSGSTRGKEF